MEKSDVYKCENCKTLVSILKAGKVEANLHCCGGEMVNVTPPAEMRISSSRDMARPGAP